MHQHHRDTPAAVRLQREQVVVGWCRFGPASTLLSSPDSSLVQPFPSTANSARTAVWSYSSGTLCPSMRILAVS